MKIGINLRYLLSFIILFIVEVLIAIYLKHGFIRAQIGDVLVVVLIYCLIKSFVRNRIKWLPLYIFIFAALVEIGQYFNLVKLLGLSQNLIARIIIGTTFDINDIICYFVGCVMLYIFENHTTDFHG